MGKPEKAERESLDNYAHVTELRSEGRAAKGAGVARTPMRGSEKNSNERAATPMSFWLPGGAAPSPRSLPRSLPVCWVRLLFLICGS